MLKIFLVYSTILCVTYAQHPILICYPATLNFETPRVKGTGESKVESISSSGYSSSVITTSEVSEESSESIKGSGSHSVSINTKELPEEIPFNSKSSKELPKVTATSSITTKESPEVSAVNSISTKELTEKIPFKPNNSGKPQFLDETPNFIFRFDTGNIKSNVQGTSRRFQTSNGTIRTGEGQYGNYSYTGSDGKVRTVVFSSDENGYQPRFV